MRKTARFYSALAVLLALMLADGLLTYLNTPDLAHEANPLVAVLGLGWGALLIANLLAFVLLFVLGRYAFVQYETLAAPVANRRQYVSQLFYRRPDKFVWCLYKLPKSWKPLWALMGYVFIYSFIAARAVLVFEWALVTANLRIATYSSLRGSMPFGRLDIVLALVVMVCLMFRWVDKEYKASAAMVAAQG